MKKYKFASTIKHPKKHSHIHSDGTKDSFHNRTGFHGEIYKCENVLCWIENVCVCEWVCKRENKKVFRSTIKI
jgi:hypothetical protein